ATSASYISTLFKGVLLFFRIATTAGRRVPLPFSAPLEAAGSAFFGDEILRFSAAFGVLCFSAIEFAPWSKTLSWFSSVSIFSAIWAACAKVFDEKYTELI